MNFLILLDHIIVSGSRFLLSVLVARFLGLDDFGVYALIWTIVTLASAMQIPISITPMMQIGPVVLAHRRKAFFASALMLQLGFGLATLPITVFGLILIIPDAYDVVLLSLIASVYIFIFNFYEYFRRYFFAEGNQVAALCFDLVLYSLILACVYVLVEVSSFSILTYFALTLVPTGFLIILMVKVYTWRTTTPIVHRVFMRRLLRISYPLVSSSLASFITGHAFVFSTAFFLGTNEVGGIAAVRNIVGPFMIILMALENSLIRTLTLYSKNQAMMRKYANEVSFKWLCLFVVFALGLSFASEFLMDLLYGNEFIVFSEVIPWFCAATLFQVVSRVQTVRLRTEGQYVAIKKANIATMYFMLVTSPVLIMIFGIKGAGYSVVLISVLILIFQDLFEREGFIIRFVKSTMVGKLWQ